MNSVQKYMREKTRLGIPVFFIAEALHGYMAAGATSFPQAIALGGTWDTALVERVFSAPAQEASAARHPPGPGPGPRRGPRSPLGPLRGVLRRGPVPGLAHGDGRDLRAAGQGPGHRPGARRRHPQALRRTRRAAGRPQHRSGELLREGVQERPPVPLRDGRQGGARALDHGLVQRVGRRPEPRQPQAPHGHPAGRVGVRRLRDGGRRGRRVGRRRAPRRRLLRRRGDPVHRGRPRLRRGRPGQLLRAPRGGGEGREGLDGGDRPRRGQRAPGQVPLRALRPAVRRSRRTRTG